MTPMASSQSKRPAEAGRLQKKLRPRSPAGGPKPRSASAAPLTKGLNATGIGRGRQGSAPGGIRTRDLHLSQRCALSTELRGRRRSRGTETLQAPQPPEPPMTPVRFSNLKVGVHDLSSRAALARVAPAMQGRSERGGAAPRERARTQQCASAMPPDSAGARGADAQKGLFVNSRNLCHKAKRNRARANAKGQNGRRELTKPPMRAQCGKAKRKRHAKHKRGGRR